MSKRDERKVIFCDIDGTLIKKQSTLREMLSVTQVLPGTYEKLSEWRANDYMIVLTTARPESTRNQTIYQLTSVGIFWDQLVMGLPTGERYVINDSKRGWKRAYGIALEQDQGIKDVELLNYGN